MRMPAPRITQEGLSLAPTLRESLSAGFISLDPEAELCHLNARARELIGFSKLPAEPISSKELPPTLLDLLKHSLLTQQDLNGHFLPTSQDLERQHWLIVSTHYVQGSGRATVCAVLNDLTPARQLEQKMQLLDRLASIGTLSASMAHEIKNALVAIKTFVELLLKHNKDAELAGIVSRELDRIDSIVSQMLRFAGPAKPTFDSVHVHEILQHALRLLQHQTEARQVQLHCHFDAQPDTIHGDDYQLEQAFVNLLLNAIEATPANGQIHVSTQIAPGGNPGQDLQAPRWLAVNIQDSGAGISSENLEKLFQPFFTTKPTGTGLGLPITQRIVRDHRGAVEVQSEPNQGTTFRVQFPLRETEPS